MKAPVTRVKYHPENKVYEVEQRFSLGASFGLFNDGCLDFLPARVESSAPMALLKFQASQMVSVVKRAKEVSLQARPNDRKTHVVNILLGTEGVRQDPVDESAVQGFHPGCEEQGRPNFQQKKAIFLATETKTAVVKIDGPPGRAAAILPLLIF